MKLLFVGDSITQGTLGVSFVDHLSAQFGGTTTNLGKDGETLNIIFNRLLEHLKVENDYDFIIIQGGYNDLLLPTFTKKGFWFNFAYQQQIKKGLHPSTVEELEAFLMVHILKVRELYKGKIMMLTIGCVGEQSNTPLNLKRNRFNEIIKQIAEKQKLYVADTQIKFDEYLKNKEQSAYCLDNFWSVMIWDKLSKKWDYISKSRKLHLTIDGVHLNTEGAKIFADSVAKWIVAEQTMNI